MGGCHGVELDSGETTFDLHRVRNVTAISHSIPKSCFRAPASRDQRHLCRYGALRALLLWSNRDDFV